MIFLYWDFNWLPLINQKLLPSSSMYNYSQRHPLSFTNQIRPQGNCWSESESLFNSRSKLLECLMRTLMQWPAFSFPQHGQQHWLEHCAKLTVATKIPKSIFCHRDWMIRGLKTGLFIFTFDLRLNKNDCWNIQNKTDCSLRLHTTLDKASSCRPGPQPSDTSAEQRQGVSVKTTGVLARKAIV